MIDNQLKEIYVKLKSPGIFLIGLFILLFALLRLFHWSPKELILFGGIGLILVLLGIDIVRESTKRYFAIIGFILAFVAVFYYYFIEGRVTDILALLYSIGLTFLMIDIIEIDPFLGLRTQMSILSANIKSDFNSVLKPTVIEKNLSKEDLIELASDVWRLEKRIHKIDKNLSDSQLRAFESSLSKFNNLLNKHEIEIIDYTNKGYIAGLNVEVILFEKDATTSSSFIKETIEPTILYRGQLEKRAKVIVVEK